MNHGIVLPLLLFVVGALLPSAGSGANIAEAEFVSAPDSGCHCDCPSGWQPRCQEECCNSTAKCVPAHGTVVDKDDSAKTFKVTPKKGDIRSFTANDKTTYWPGKKKSDWAGFNNGDTVSVTCTATKGGTDLAKSVKWASAKAAAKKAATKPSPKPSPKTGR